MINNYLKLVAKLKAFLQRLWWNQPGGWRRIPGWCSPYERATAGGNKGRRKRI